jgi:hypothetical protein
MHLQIVLNRVKQLHPDAPYELLLEDGRMGKKTRIAAEWAEKQLGPALSNMLATERELFMRDLARKLPKFRKYVVANDGGLGGWIKRARSYRESA